MIITEAQKIAFLNTKPWLALHNYNSAPTTLDRWDLADGVQSKAMIWAEKYNAEYVAIETARLAAIGQDATVEPAPIIRSYSQIKAELENLYPDTNSLTIANLTREALAKQSLSSSQLAIVQSAPSSNTILSAYSYQNKVDEANKAIEAFFASATTKAIIATFKADPFTSRVKWDALQNHLKGAPVNRAGSDGISDFTPTGLRKELPEYNAFHDAASGIRDPLLGQLMGQAQEKFDPGEFYADPVGQGLMIMGAALTLAGGLAMLEAAPSITPLTGSAATATDAYAAAVQNTLNAAGGAAPVSAVGAITEIAPDVILKATDAYANAVQNTLNVAKVAAPEIVKQAAPSIITPLLEVVTVPLKAVTVGAKEIAGAVAGVGSAAMAVQSIGGEVDKLTNPNPSTGYTRTTGINTTQTTKQKTNFMLPLAALGAALIAFL